MEKPPRDPTPDDVERARKAILQDFLGDFRFASDSDRAHAVVLLLQPLVRLMIRGLTPLFLVEAAIQGTGKTLLVKVIHIVITGQGPALMSEGGDNDEWRKRISSSLLAGNQFVIFDNVSQCLDSSAMAMALTSDVWTDRILGRLQNVALRVECTWVATGNNPQVSKENARRIVPIRLTADEERPEERGGFLHPDLEEWTKANRGVLLSACYTLINHWIARGKPRGSKDLGSYGPWAKVMGGILEAAGIPGFLENRHRFNSQADAESLELSFLFKAIGESVGMEPFGAELATTTCRSNHILDGLLAGKDEVGARAAVGRLLNRHRDAIHGGWKLEVLSPDLHTKTGRYRLRKLSG